MQALVELHEDDSVMGVLHPEVIAMAPDAYITDFSYGAVEDCGRQSSLLCAWF